MLSVNILLAKSPTGEMLVIDSWKSSIRVTLSYVEFSLMLVSINSTGFVNETYKSKFKAVHRQRAMNNCSELWHQAAAAAAMARGPRQTTVVHKHTRE